MCNNISTEKKKSPDGLIIGKCFLTKDSSKPSQKIIFSRKKQFQSHPTISVIRYLSLKSILSKTPWNNSCWKLNFKQHVDNAISKINKGTL